MRECRAASRGAITTLVRLPRQLSAGLSHLAQHFAATGGSFDYCIGQRKDYYYQRGSTGVRSRQASAGDCARLRRASHAVSRQLLSSSWASRVVRAAFNPSSIGLFCSVTNFDDYNVTPFISTSASFVFLQIL